MKAEDTVWYTMCGLLVLLLIAVLFLTAKLVKLETSTTESNIECNCECNPVYEIKQNFTNYVINCTNEETNESIV